MQPHIFELTQLNISGNIKEVSYPSFDLSTRQLESFSSLQLAEKALKEHIKTQQEQEDYPQVYCYSINEYTTEMLVYSYAETRRVYQPSGELMDECLLSEFDIEGSVFLGRPAEKIRFKQGDMVEVLRDDKVELGIVVATPRTPEWIKERDEREVKKYPESPEGAEICRGDYSDDCYNVLVGESWDTQGNSDGSLYSFKPGGYDDFHAHPQSICLFKPRFSVAKEMEKSMRLALQSFVGLPNHN